MWMVFISACVCIAFVGLSVMFECGFWWVSPCRIFNPASLYYGTITGTAI